MTRAVATVLLLALLAGTAHAGRLGGAYRGPYGPDWEYPHRGGGAPGGKRAIIDLRSFWMNRFEWEKETILAERITALRARAKRPTAEDVEKLVRSIFTEAVVHDDPRIRDAAIFAMAKTGAGWAVPLLLERARKDPDPEVKQDALLALGLIGGPMAVGELAEFLGGKDPFAALGLGLTGDPAALKPLLAAWRKAQDADPFDEALAGGIAVALGAVAGEKDVPALGAPIVMRGRRPLKVHVCQALGRVGGAKARDWLLRALADRLHGVGNAAAAALGWFPEDAVARTLLGKHGVGSGLNLRKCASLTSLAKIAIRLQVGFEVEKQGRAALKKAAGEPQKNIYAAMHAAIAQGEAGFRDSVPYFLTQVRAKGRKFRDENHAAMAMALGLLREPEAVLGLQELVRTDTVDRELRGYAAFALGLFGGRGNALLVRDAMKARAAHPDLVRSGCWSLALIGGDTDLPHLLPLLRREGKENVHVRGAAAIAIGLLGDAETLAKLATIAADADETPATRAFAIASIGWLIDRDPVPRLPRMFAGLDQNHTVKPIVDAMRSL